MQNWLRKLERIATAAAFAEEGEWRMAGKILDENEKRPAKRRSETLRRPQARAADQPYRT